MPEISPPDLSQPRVPQRTALYPFWQFLGTGFYSGYAPIASGTAGSFVALLIYYLMPGMDNTLTLGLITLATILIGIPASTALATIHGDDPGIVVIDEFAGMWVSLLFLPKSVGIALLAFFLFRLYDIIKPPPARQMERIPNGTGIMLDDIVAGIYANLSTQLIYWIFPALGA